MVKYYRFESPLFPIQRGTWQGCPLSPLLFVLDIEPLAETIHCHTDIRGLEVTGPSHKISLFAADILLCITSLHLSLPNLWFLDIFASLSGLHVNPTKSEAMTVTLSATTIDKLFSSNGLPLYCILLSVLYQHTRLYTWLTTLTYFGKCLPCLIRGLIFRCHGSAELMLSG